MTFAFYYSSIKWAQIFTVNIITVNIYTLLSIYLWYHVSFWFILPQVGEWLNLGFSKQIKEFGLGFKTFEGCRFDQITILIHSVFSDRYAWQKQFRPWFRRNRMHGVWLGSIQQSLVTMTAFVSKDIAIKMNLLLYRILHEQIDM